MDAAALRTRIQATLDSNADARRQAELDLRNVILNSALTCMHCVDGADSNVTDNPLSRLRKMLASLTHF